MAWIETIGETEAQGKLRREYETSLSRAGKVYNIVKISSLRPEFIQRSMSFYVTLMHEVGHLTRAQREMIAVVVSRTNDCFY